MAAAWKGTPEATAERAAELMPTGNIAWGLDAEEEVFAAFGVPYQPVTVLIDEHMRVVAQWPGALEEAEIRAAIEDNLLT